jgi:uncharacterized surface protein with fasciclin (FAS1) repeats
MRPIALAFAALLAATPAHATWKRLDAPERPAETVAELARADARLATLVQALEAAGLDALLDGGGRFTLYAPSEAAFAALPPGTLDALLLEENRARLVALLRYHVDDRELRSRDLPEAVIRVQTLLKESRICVGRRDGGVAVADAGGAVATVTEADIRAANGTIHVIDRVLVPGGVPDCAPVG